MARRTVTVRDEAGNISQVDVPDESETYPYKFWCEHLAAGRYVIVEDDDEPPVSPSSDPAELDPSGTIDAIVAWVRGGTEDDEPTEGWDKRAAEALAAETAKGDDARSSLVKLLSPLVTPPSED